MRWIYILIIALVLFHLAFFLPPVLPPGEGAVERIVSETGVPNSVTGILLRNRLYDTLFELMVFSLSVIGVQLAFSRHESENEIFHLKDPTMIILARIGAMVSALIFMELVLRGHLAPGGGFAAGVAGGTSIGLVTLTGNTHELHAFHRRWHVDSMEKIIVMAALLSGCLLLATGFGIVGPGAGVLSIPLLNILIALKVAIGSWTITLLFVRHRGLL